MNWVSGCSAASRVWRRSERNCSPRCQRRCLPAAAWPSCGSSVPPNATSWEEVHDLSAAAFARPSPERVASYSSRRSSNEAAYLLQLLLRALGPNNLADCSDLCHAPSSIGLGRVFGSGTSMVSLENLQQADCVVLVGSMRRPTTRG